MLTFAGRYQYTFLIIVTVVVARECVFALIQVANAEARVLARVHDFLGLQIGFRPRAIDIAVEVAAWGETALSKIWV
jgi:hypothetical protein